MIHAATTKTKDKTAATYNTPGKRDRAMTVRITWFITSNRKKHDQEYQTA